MTDSQQALFSILCDVDLPGQNYASTQSYGEFRDLAKKAGV